MVILSTPFGKWCRLSLVLINNYVRFSWQVSWKKIMIMYMQSILDKMDALQNDYRFFVLVSRICFHLIKCLWEIDHFVGYSPSNSSHFISLVFSSELDANCLIQFLQHKNQVFLANNVQAFMAGNVGSGGKSLFYISNFE